MSETNLEVMKFDGVKIPKPYESTEKSNDNYVQHGSDNVYPNFLLKLYNECPVHASIINSKADYVKGDGLRYKGGKLITTKVNAADNFDELISKVVKDYILFNCFAIEVVYNPFKVPIEYHFVPAHRVRCNKSKTQFWVSEDWQQGTKPLKFERWKTLSTDATSKIFFYDGYNPSLSNVYPTPEYHGCVTSILTDMEIRTFNLNNLRNHFSVSTILTFFRGSNIPEDQKEKIMKGLKDSYTGSTGKKLIVDFQDPNSPAADVKSISPNDWDKAYELIAKSVKDDIIQAHQVTSPILFGVKTEGQLGGSTELETAYEIFQNTYARNKRNELLSAFNQLFSVGELIQGELEFAEKQLFSARISETLKEKVYTINELRKEAGLPTMVDGDKLLTEAAKTDAIPQKMNSDVFQLSEEDFEKIKDMGVFTSEFDFIDELEPITSKEDFNRIELQFETADEIAKYIIDNKLTDASVNELKQRLRKDLGINVSSSELKDTLAHLAKSGVIDNKVQDDKIKVKPNSNPSKKIEVVYSYDIRKGYGNAIEDNTRAFCKKLIENNRYYTREEVQTMTAIFGYDIFSYGGGFYRNPQTGDVTPHCRHYFKAVTVTRKNKNQN
jgi:hypothetical protein